MIEKIKKEARNALEDGWYGVLGLRRRWGQVGPFLFQEAANLEEIEIEPKYCLARTIQAMLESSPLILLIKLRSLLLSVQHHVPVAKCNRQCIGDIGRLRRFFHFEGPRDRALHLHFRCAAVAGE